MNTTVELNRAHPAVARVAFRSEGGVQLLSAAVRDQLRLVLDAIEADENCRVVVFEAAGRTFIAGADINELRALTPRTAWKCSREGQKLFQRVADLRVPTLAAIHAACAGGGCELSLACDIRLAAATARIGLPEITIGLVPGWGGTVRSVQVCGSAAARRVMLTGELLTAAEALRLGLVHEVVADEAFRPAVETRIAQLLKGAPQAGGQIKRMVDRLQSTREKANFRMEARQVARCYRSREPAEGLAAFLEKRPADWAVSPEPEPEQESSGTT